MSLGRTISLSLTFLLMLAQLPGPRMGSSGGSKDSSNKRHSNSSNCRSSKPHNSGQPREVPLPVCPAGLPGLRAIAR